MSTIKTEKEIEVMREGGYLLSDTLLLLAKNIRNGIQINELDAMAEKALLDGGGEPAFKGYAGKHDKTPFPSTVCVSVNDEIVHGLGCRENFIKNGDIVGLDLGVKFNGYYTDMAVTVPVGKVDSRAADLIYNTRQALFCGLKVVKDSARISDIGLAIEKFVKPFGYGIVRDLTGHGVGENIHSDPHIPNYYDRRYDNVRLKAGETIAIEPMLTLGDWRTDVGRDGWTVVTRDGSLAAHFEVTILVTKDGYEILTPMI